MQLKLHCVFVLALPLHLLSLCMWQWETQLFASPFISLAYFFEASYSKLVTSESKDSSVDQSELEK